jgi:hypothetical protein
LQVTGEVNRPDPSNNFNYEKQDGKNASCCAAMGFKLLTSPEIPETYTLLMNSGNTLWESYQQRVYNDTVSAVHHQIELTENKIPAEVIRTEAVHIDNAILLDYLTSNVALEEAMIESSDPYILLYNHYPDDMLHFGLPCGSKDWDNESDTIDESYAIPTTCWRRWAETEFQKFELRTCDVNRYESDNGCNADPDVEEGVL